MKNELEDKLWFLRKRYAYQKWQLRVDTTIIYRQSHKKLMARWNLSRKRNIFKALNKHYDKHDDLKSLLI